MVDQGPHHRHPLALSAGKTAWQVFIAVPQPHSLEQLIGPEQNLVTHFGRLGQHGNQNILQDRQMRQQVVGLENEADVAVAEPRQFISAHHG